MSDIEKWNELLKPSDEVDVEAKQNDLVVEIAGIIYLLQRQNNINNVVCFRTHKSEVSLLQSFFMYRKWLLGNCIQFIRVEGNTRRYMFLKHLDCIDMVQDIDESIKTNRNIFYIDLLKE